jgi:hypothetical protein
MAYNCKYSCYTSLYNCYHYLEDLITYIQIVSTLNFLGITSKFHIARDILKTIPNHVLIASCFLTQESLQFSPHFDLLSSYSSATVHVDVRKDGANKIPSINREQL